MKNIGKKILAVMKEVESVEKDGFNAFHKYKYTSDAAIVTAIRKSLIHNGLIVCPDQKSCIQNGDITSLTVEYTVLDTDSGEMFKTTVIGYGQDKGDKGVYKAATGAEKYFLLKTFLVPTDDDPEKENGRPTTKEVSSTRTHNDGASYITEKQQKRLYSIWKSAGKDDAIVKEYLLNEYGLTHTREITMDIYENICKWAESK